MGMTMKTMLLELGLWGEGEGAASEKKCTHTPPPRGGMVIVCFACGDDGKMVSESESAPNCSGKGMRICEKIEVDYDDNIFVGCERTSEHFAVVAEDPGHDDEGVALLIWLLGRRGGSGSEKMHTYPPPPGVYVFFAFRMWGRWDIRFRGRERTESLWQRNADQRKN